MKTEAESRHYKELSNIYQLLVFLLLLFIVFELLREELEAKIIVAVLLVPVFIYIIHRCKKVLTLEHRMSVLQAELVPGKDLDNVEANIKPMHPGFRDEEHVSSAIEMLNNKSLKPYYFELTKVSEGSPEKVMVMVLDHE